MGGEMNNLKRWAFLFPGLVLVMISVTTCAPKADIPPDETDYVAWTGISGFEQPVWSPDGTMLALKEFKDPQAQEHTRLFLYAFGHQQMIPITGTMGDYRAISWSPDSLKLVVAKVNERKYGKDIQVVDLKAGQITTVGFGEGAAWSPNGQSIAIYVGPKTNTSQGQFGIHLVRPDGISIKTIPLPIAPTPITWYDEYDGMSWAPDSQWITLSIMHWSSDNKLTGEIYVIDVNGDRFRQITTEGRNREPAWSPDGKIIAYIAMGPASIFGKVHLVSPDGSCASLLSDDLMAQSLSWSPDSNQIAYEYKNGVYILDFKKKLTSGSIPDSSCR
jgi:Tol biopolymer transport system component